MNRGYFDRILIVDLTTGESEIFSPGEEFFRSHLGGGGIGAWFLLKETGPDTDPLSADNVLVVAPGVATGAAVSGVSRCAATSLSPLTNMAVDSQAGGSIGPMIKRAGYDAIVVKGRATRLSFLVVDGNGASIENAEGHAGKTVIEVHRALVVEHGEKGTSVIQCGPAGERMVRFANIIAGTCDAFGRGGLGAVMGSKNLRAIVVKGSTDPSFADPNGMKILAKSGASRLPGSGFPETLKKFGTPGVVKFQAEAGNFATHNYSRGWHPEYLKLHGETYEPSMAAGSATCFACVVGCRKRVKIGGHYPVSDGLGGPEFETLGMLGANLDIIDPAVVAAANELCNNLGLDTITMGSVAGYVFECIEEGMITTEQAGGFARGFGNPDALLGLVRATAAREGIGDLCADGFGALVSYFGERTRPFAVQVKGAGLPVHMPQVKPSLALMYAVCPTGPDHMSSEHDWLLASGSEASRGLAITGQEDSPSTSLNKVRMTAYSQIFYSLLDSLSLCMFVWGPGSLYPYRELEDLVAFATGWQVTLWELMKVGERRVNMFRLINARRGFGREQDNLPDRLFVPLPDGPSDGRHVGREDFERMKDEYYSIMGWDRETGNPGEGKLRELGLEWAL